MFELMLNLFSSWGIKVPHVFFYLSTRMVMSVLTTLLLTIFCGPFFIRKLYQLKIGQKIRSSAECPLLAKLHQKKKETPTMGGILILFSMSISLFLWMDLTRFYTWALLFVTVGLGIVGGIDDYYKLKYKNSKGIRPKVKMLMQLMISILVLSPFFISKVQQSFPSLKIKPMIVKSLEHHEAVFLQENEAYQRLYIPFMKKPIVFPKTVGTVLIFILGIFVIVGTSNAVNLTDGLDGLAAGCLIMVAAVFALFAFLSNHFELSRYLNLLYIEGSGEIAIYLCAMIGACLGFLWYNGHPAQIFMGDTGSLALGGVLGLSSIMLRREILLAVVGGVFVAEALSVILQVLSYRYRNQKRIFLCSPLHHHFEYKGWPETKVVVRFWIISLLLAFIGIGSIKFQ
ncbi:MAG TPA: phospho-N-acetylmuramoyl-pentapeptide-transferase [Chlamydiales bacterium]|nr:phospho-N-acetylmuramoyl-pentapeptide-transferase [Chlamydiales bacterium]